MKKFSSFCVILFLSSCASLFQSRPQTDCSGVFENDQPTKNSTQITQKLCKVLPIKIHSGAECEISGSDKVDNFFMILKQDNKDRAILVAPINVLLDSGDSMSYKNQLVMYFIKNKIKKYLSSDLFTELKDYRYQGLSCKFQGNKITGWLVDDRLIALIEEKTNKKK